MLGEQYANRLYASSDEALSVLINKPELMSKARKLIAENKDAVIAIANGGQASVSNTDEVLAFLDEFSDKSPVQLKILSQHVKRELLKKREQGREFFGFNLEPVPNQKLVVR